MNGNSSNSLSRRSFLRLSALGMGAGALAACMPVAAPGGGDGGAMAEPTAVSFLTQGGGEISFLRYEPLIEDFQAANTDITIDPIWEPGRSNPDSDKAADADRGRRRAGLLLGAQLYEFRAGSAQHSAGHQPVY